MVCHPGIIEVLAAFSVIITVGEGHPQAGIAMNLAAEMERVLCRVR
jgi:hypothetical protein